MRLRRILLPVLVLLFGLSACDSVDDTVIPSMRVAINIGDTGLWNSFGVSGYGQFRYFIRYDNTLEPQGFPFTAATFTGYGGVLLISGMDPFTTEVGVPLAYDLSCPVEKSQTIRVVIDPETLEAVCPVCGSRFDVTMRGGTPISGPAEEGKRKLGLRRYRCLATSTGGYVITN